MVVKWGQRRGLAEQFDIKHWKGAVIMLQEAIEKNRGFLRVCAVAAVIVGALSLGIHVFTRMQMILGLKDPLELWGINLLVMSVYGMAEALLRAMVLFALADLIRWALDRDSKPGWMLRHVDKIIYLQVALTVAYYIASQLIMHRMQGPRAWPWLAMGGSIVMWAVYVSLGIGFGVLKGMAAGRGVRLIEECQKAK
jgi:hypothetical protein